MTTTTCPHHWLIETPNGRYSRGECKLCHEVRQDFQSGYFSDYDEAHVNILRRNIKNVRSGDALTTRVTDTKANARRVGRTTR